jgi:hypothetical protein
MALQNAIDQREPEFFAHSTEKRDKRQGPRGVPPWQVRRLLHNLISKCPPNGRETPGYFQTRLNGKHRIAEFAGLESVH